MAPAESLPDYCRHLLDEVVEVSDYQIQIEEHSALQLDPFIQLPRAGLPLAKLGLHNRVALPFAAADFSY